MLLRGRWLIGLWRAFILHSVGYFCTALVPVGSNGVKNLFKRKVGSDFRFRDWSNFLTIRIEQLFENYVIVAHANSVSLNRIESNKLEECETLEPSRQVLDEPEPIFLHVEPVRHRRQVRYELDRGLCQPCRRTVSFGNELRGRSLWAMVPRLRL